MALHTLPSFAPEVQWRPGWWTVSALGFVLLVGGTGAALPLLLAAGASGVWAFARCAFGTWHPGRILADGVVRNAVSAVGLVAAGLQVAILVEHLARVGMWLRSPAAPPFATVWTTDAAARVQHLAPGIDGLGLRVVDLLAASVVLAGATVLARPAAGAGPTSRRAGLVRCGRLVVGEHLLLVTTTLLLGRPLGATTALGLLGDGVTGRGVTVLVQAGVALVVALVALGAARETRRHAGHVGLGHVPVVVRRLPR